MYSNYILKKYCRHKNECLSINWRNPKYRCGSITYRNNYKRPRQVSGLVFMPDKVDGFAFWSSIVCFIFGMFYVIGTYGSPDQVQYF